MENDIVRIAEKGIAEAIGKELTGYNKPLTIYIDEVIANHKQDFMVLIDKEVSTLLSAKAFKAALSKALNDKLARVLVSKLGGALEKQINDLKQNPETRAKITLAIASVIDELAATTI